MRLIDKMSKGLILFFSCLLVLTSYAHGEKKHMTLAILPCTDVVMSFKKFNPLAVYLEQETGFKIKLIIPTDSEGFERSIRSGDIDFAFLDPHTYIKLANLFNKSALIKTLTLKGAIFQCGIVIARKDSHIRKIEDLKGKMVMFGSRFSAAKWLAAKLLFEENGINIEKDLKSYSNGGCCEDIAFNIYLKEVDAGVVCDHFLEEHSEKQQELGLEAEQIMIVAKTKLVPTRVFAVRRGISKQIVTKIMQALLKINKTRPEYAKILNHAELGGFQRAQDEDYDCLRMLLGEKPQE